MIPVGRVELRVPDFLVQWEILDGFEVDWLGPGPLLVYFEEAGYNGGS